MITGSEARMSDFESLAKVFKNHGDLRIEVVYTSNNVGNTNRRISNEILKVNCLAEELLNNECIVVVDNWPSYIDFHLTRNLTYINEQMSIAKAEGWSKLTRLSVIKVHVAETKVIYFLNPSKWRLFDYKLAKNLLRGENFNWLLCKDVADQSTTEFDNEAYEHSDGSEEYDEEESNGEASDCESTDDDGNVGPINDDIVIPVSGNIVINLKTYVLPFIVDVAYKISDTLPENNINEEPAARISALFNIIAKLCTDRYCSSSGIQVDVHTYVRT